MKLAILFWFYKEPEICQNRLELLRQNNPTISIYGLNLTILFKQSVANRAMVVA